MNNNNNNNNNNNSHHNKHKLERYNGRVRIPTYKEGVDIDEKNTSKLFSMYDKIPATQCLTFRDPLIGICENSVLSSAFFSAENIQIIQNGIRAGVYEETNKKEIIAEQDCDTIKIIMRDVYIQNAKHLPNNIPQQISELNQLVLNYCIPKIMSELKSYKKYLNDVTTLVKPLARPIDTQTHSKRAYKMNTWF